MDKELSPELFGESSTVRRRPEAREAVSFDDGGFLDLDRQILELRQQMSRAGEETAKLTSRLTEMTKDNQLRMDRLAQQLQRLELSHNGLVNEAGQRITMINQRLSERKSMDQKIQELMDRHAQTIKSFEVRMQQMQRLLAEKESQAMSTQAALNEAKMEIARLKRL